MGKKSRNKGANFEREIVSILNAHGLNATRTAPLQAGMGSGGAADIYCRDIGYVEAKHRANGMGFIYDAMKDADLVVFRADRKRSLAIIDLDHFIEIVLSKKEGSK